MTQRIKSEEDIAESRNSLVETSGKLEMIGRRFAKIKERPQEVTSD
jgi:hypothetical protein